VTRKSVRELMKKKRKERRSGRAFLWKRVVR
jgi:hypothetical protein